MPELTREQVNHYKIKLSEVIQLNQINFGQPLISSVKGLNGEPSELRLVVDGWFELLSPHIPLNRLRDTYDLARTRHQSSFKIAPNDLLITFRFMREVESAQEAQRAADMPKANCRYEHNNEDEKLVELGSPGNWYWLPCPDCRPAAYRQRHSEMMAEQALKDDKKTLDERMSQLSEMKSKIRQLKPQPIDLECTACRKVFESVSENKIMQKCSECLSGMLVPVGSLK